MSRTVSLLGSQWTTEEWTPSLPGFMRAANVADPQFQVPEAAGTFYPAPFSAALLRKWFYRVKKLHVEAFGAWDITGFDLSRTEGSFTCDGELEINQVTDEVGAFEIEEHAWGYNWMGETPDGPVGSGSQTVKDSEGTVIESVTFDVFFFCGFHISTELGGIEWHSDDGEEIRKHFLAGFFASGAGIPFFPIANTYESNVTTTVAGALDFDGQDVPLLADGTTITATVTPAGFWPYGGTYDPDTGEPPA